MLALTFAQIVDAAHTQSHSWLGTRVFSLSLSLSAVYVEYVYTYIKIDVYIYRDACSYFIYLSV